MRKILISLLILFSFVFVHGQTKHNISLKQLKDVDIPSTPTTNYVLSWNGSFWVAIAPGSTPTLQQVLDAGSTLTSSETITVSGNLLSISGTSNVITFNDGLGAIRVTNSNTAGLSISSTNTGTANFFTRSATSDAFPVASFKNTTSGTNTAARVFSLGRATTGTPTDGLAVEQFFSLETAGVGAAEDIVAGRFRYKFSTVDHPTRTSQIDMDGVDNGAEETFMNVQKDLVRINNNVDTLATKAYARSVGGGGGGTPALTQYRLAVGDASNLLSDAAAITGARALVSDANGVPTHSATTATEIGYVNGVTSSIQTQIDAKASLTGTETLTNKRWTARVGSTTSSGTPTINTDNVDVYKLTAQTADITSFTTNLSGTPVDGDMLEIQITGTAARAITWGASFVSSTVTLPTTTVTTATLSVVFQYFTTSSYGNNKWVCVNYF